jgi:hypothetical protein
MMNEKVMMYYRSRACVLFDFAFWGPRGFSARDPLNSNQYPNVYIYTSFSIGAYMKLY